MAGKKTAKVANKTPSVSDVSCVVCLDEVKEGQDGLECSMCQKWCHRQCPSTKRTNVRDALYLAHSDADDDQPWFCPVCKPLLPTVLATYREFQAHKLEMDNKMVSIQAQIDDLKKGAVTRPVATSSILPGTSVDIQAEIQEVFEKEKKKLSLVVVGLPEEDKSTLRSDADREFLLGMCGRLGFSKKTLLTFSETVW